MAVVIFQVLLHSSLLPGVHRSPPRRILYLLTAKSMGSTYAQNVVGVGVKSYCSNVAAAGAPDAS